MPETLSFRVQHSHVAELHAIRAVLTRPTQVLGPAPSPSGRGWTAYLLTEGSIRGINVLSEPDTETRRIDIKREGCASAADFRLMKEIADLAAQDPGCTLAINGQAASLADLRTFFAPDRNRKARASEWGQILERYFRRGRGRAVFSCPLADLTVHLEDVDYPNFMDHLDELEERLASRLLPVLRSQVAILERLDDGRSRFTFVRWSVQVPTLVPEVEQTLIQRGDQAIGFVPLRELFAHLGNRIEISRDRPPRRILLPGLDLHRDIALLTQIERKARSRPVVLA